MVFLTHVLQSILWKLFHQYWFNWNSFSINTWSHFLALLPGTSNICIESKKPLVKRGKVKQTNPKAFKSKYLFLELKKQVLAESTHL